MKIVSCNVENENAYIKYYALQFHYNNLVKHFNFNMDIRKYAEQFDFV